MSGLRERKKARLRQRIRETTIDLVRQRGLDAITIDEIADLCEISQPTFYAYFASKEAILGEHAARGWGPLLVRMASSGDPVPDVLRRYFEEIARDIQRDAVLWAAIAASNAYNPIKNPELLRGAETGTRVLETVLLDGQQRGQLTSEVPARLMASVIEGVMMRAVVEWAAQFPEHKELEDRLVTMFDFFMRAAKPVPATVAPGGDNEWTTHVGQQRTRASLADLMRRVFDLDVYDRLTWEDDLLPFARRASFVHVLNHSLFVASSKSKSDSFLQLFASDPGTVFAPWRAELVQLWHAA